jgi:hypothetical protein
MHVTRITRYMTLYLAFGVTRSRSWKVLPANTAVHLYNTKLHASSLIIHKQQTEQTLSPNEVGIPDGKLGNKKHIQHIHLSKYSMGESLVNYWIISWLHVLTLKKPVIISVTRSRWMPSLPPVVYRLLQWVSFCWSTRIYTSRHLAQEVTSLRTKLDSSPFHFEASLLQKSMFEDAR